MKSQAPQPPLAQISLRSFPPPWPVVPRVEVLRMVDEQKKATPSHPKKIEKLFLRNEKLLLEKDLPHSNHM